MGQAGSTSKQSQNDIQAFLDKEKDKFIEKIENPIRQNASLDQFELVRTVGTGSFGKFTGREEPADRHCSPRSGRVLLVTRRSDESNEQIALKILDKQVVVRMKQIDHTLAEKKILQALSCPFIVKLLYTFKDNSYLYMGLEYAPGGEMFTHLRACGRYEEVMTRFYAAQIVLAFEYLHHLGVVSLVANSNSIPSTMLSIQIYRDLKPENLLFSSDGYLKMVARDLRFRTRTALLSRPILALPNE